MCVSSLKPSPLAPKLRMFIHCSVAGSIGVSPVSKGVMLLIGSVSVRRTIWGVSSRLSALKPKVKRVTRYVFSLPGICWFVKRSNANIGTLLHWIFLRLICVAAFPASVRITPVRCTFSKMQSSINSLSGAFSLISTATGTFFARIRTMVNPPSLVRMALLRCPSK